MSNLKFTATNIRSFLCTVLSKSMRIRFKCEFLGVCVGSVECSVLYVSVSVTFVQTAAGMRSLIQYWSTCVSSSF